MRPGACHAKQWGIESHILALKFQRSTRIMYSLQHEWLLCENCLENLRI